MTIVWLLVCVLILGPTTHAIIIFRRYIEMRNLRTFPRDKYIIMQSGVSGKHTEWYNENVFTPVTYIITKGNVKVHHGGAGFFNVPYYEDRAQKSLIQ